MMKSEKPLNIFAALQRITIRKKRNRVVVSPAASNDQGSNCVLYEMNMRATEATPSPIVITPVSPQFIPVNLVIDRFVELLFVFMRCFGYHGIFQPICLFVELHITRSLLSMRHV